MWTAIGVVADRQSGGGQHDDGHGLRALQPLSLAVSSALYQGVRLQLTERLARCLSYATLSGPGLLAGERGDRDRRVPGRHRLDAAAVVGFAGSPEQRNRADGKRRRGYDRRG